MIARAAMHHGGARGGPVHQAAQHHVAEQAVIGVAAMFLIDRIEEQPFAKDAIQHGARIVIARHRRTGGRGEFIQN